ncbi:MAG: hypothetical protein ACREL9_07520 [Gemmatimonadales bacterium]
MFDESRRAARGAWLPVMLLAALGCQQGPSPEAQAKIEQLEQMSAERDRLMQEVAENAQALSEITGALAQVRVPPKTLKVTAESPLRASRDSMVQKIRWVTARVNESEVRLRESRERVQALTQVSDSLRTALDATITSFQDVLETQKSTIASLTEQVYQLSLEKAALSDTVNFLAAQNNTVYYVIGTKDDLLERGIIVQEGGTRFPLLFAKLGQTLVPARDLPMTEFTAINKRVVKEIPLPHPDRTYRIASQQYLGALETPVDGGKVYGANSLRIAAPEQFWITSRFLIIVEG